jgi:hypothetical protein
MNEKHFGMRLPKADYDALVALAKHDRSTVAQQVRQAVARYIALGNGVVESRDSEHIGQTGNRPHSA